MVKLCHKPSFLDLALISPENSVTALQWLSALDKGSSDKHFLLVSTPDSPDVRKERLQRGPDLDLN